MQLLILHYDLHTTPRGGLEEAHRQLSKARHGAVITLVNGLTVEVLEIDGDELPPVFAVDGEGTVTYVGGDHESD